VTTNADLALRRFRYPQSDRILWMDQLCIDQDNLQERSEQVNLMWKIFSQADTVLMWLGPDSDSLAPIAKEFIEGLQHRCDTPAKVQYDLDQAMRLEQLPPPGSLKWKAYKTLMALPHFTRVWMLQEVLLASTPKVFWGDIEMSWAQIARAAIWGAESYELQDLSSPEDGGFVVEKDCTMVRELFDGNNISGWSGSNLSWMIGVLAYRHATDPRDKIFAIFNLVPATERFGFKPDYSLSELDVYRGATLHIIALEQSVDLLQNVTYTPSHPLAQGKRWPSWIPRWGDQQDAYICGVEPGKFLPCTGRPLHYSIDEDKNILRLSGLKIGTIIAQVSWPHLSSHHILLSDFEEAWTLIKKYASSKVDSMPLALQLIWTFLACEADHPDESTQDRIREEYRWAFIGKCNSVETLSPYQLCYRSGGD
jgi:hypothetical protein